MIRIVRLGLATTVQDRGRPGWSYLGVGRSGAVDIPAHDLANRLVGNPPTAATMETSGGLCFDVVEPVLIAVTGATCAADVADGPAVGHGAPQTLPAGARVRLGRPTVGLRAYLAVRGGFAVPIVLGSRSRDTLGMLGPELTPGATIAAGPDPQTPIHADVAPGTAPSTTAFVLPGPRSDWFEPQAWSILLGQPYVVLPDTNRIGARLLGADRLCRSRHDELPSEGLVRGAVQVPPDGQPTVMLADHPVTGGYPVIAVVTERSLPAVAQAGPGTALTFVSAERARRNVVGSR